MRDPLTNTVELVYSELRFNENSDLFTQETENIWLDQRSLRYRHTMQVPPNETPEAVTSAFDAVTGVLASYGWTILFLIVVLNLLWSHFYPKYKIWRDKQEDEKREEEYKKNPDLLLAREEALQRSRQRLQEKHEQLAREHAEKMRLAEERKRQEKIEKHERMLQGKSMIDCNERSNLRGPDYNPLTGSSGGSCSYRPTRRGFGGSGGG